VNDLGHPGTVAPESEKVSAADIVDAHRRLVARAHDRGLKVHGGTILPFKNDTFGFYSPANEAARQAVNHWIRTSGVYTTRSSTSTAPCATRPRVTCGRRSAGDRAAAAQPGSSVRSHHS
jgi:hypothetical protein